MGKLVYGVGINDVDYTVQNKVTTGYVNGRQKMKLIWICPFYRQWKDMLARCYSDKLKSKFPTYKGVYCIEGWHSLSEYKKWAEQQDWEGKQLDKDILVPNNKIYSPETCAFVNKSTNIFLTDRVGERGDCMLGVSWLERLQKFQANCSNMFSGKMEYLGVYHKEADAHEAWRKRKHELAQLVAATESDPRVVEALKGRYSVEEWYSSNVLH